MAIWHVLRWVTVPFDANQGKAGCRCQRVWKIGNFSHGQLCVWECTADMGRALDGLEWLPYDMCRGRKIESPHAPSLERELRLGSNDVLHHSGPFAWCLPTWSQLLHVSVSQGSMVQTGETTGSVDSSLRAAEFPPRM